MQNFTYRRHTVPPVPVLDVRVLADPMTDGARDRVLSLLVDRGADGTILPRDVVAAVGAPLVASRGIEGSMGRRLVAELYRVTLVVAGHTIYGIDAVALTGADPVLGRDVLNQLRLFLDGPAEVLEVYE